VLSAPWIRLHDISKDGRVLLSRETWRRQLIGLFPGDPAEHPYSWLDDTSATALSNDGRWLSFNESGEVYYLESENLAYYRRTDGSAAISLGAGQSAISPDGKWILTFGRKSKLVLQPIGAGAPKELPSPGLTYFSSPTWSDDGRSITYEGLTSQSEWNVYTQKIENGPPVLVKAQGRNAEPVLSPDGSIVALHEGAGGIALYRAGNSQPAPLQGTQGLEYPVRFVEGGLSLLIADTSSKEISLTIVDLATGRRTPWKRLSLSVQSKGKPIVVTPDLKYYAYSLPRYSSNLYLVENLH